MAIYHYIGKEINLLTFIYFLIIEFIMIVVVIIIIVNYFIITPISTFSKFLI